MKKLLIYLSNVLLFLLLASCSDDDLSYFQKNDPEPEFSLFDILDDFPALKSAFDPIDQRRFNELLANALNDNLKEAKDVLSLTDDLLVDPDHPVTDSISHLRNTLHRVISQDDIDIDPANTRASPENYANGLYDLWDKISEKDISISENIVSILRKVVSYIKDTYRGEELEDIMTDLIAYIKDKEPYLWRDNENNLCEDLGKLLFQGNENIWLDENGKMITDRDRIEEYGKTDLGVGNAAKGMDALLSGVNAMMKDEKMRENIFIILREAGDLFTARVKGKKLKEVIKDFVHNIQKYLTPGGEEWEKWEEYEWPRFNPYSGYGKDADGNFTDNKDRLYANADLKNTLHCFLAAAQVLLMRADREGSILFDKDKTKTYFLEIFTDIFSNVEEHPDSTLPDTLFAHLEESIYDHLRFDMAARDRLSVDTYDEDNFDPSKEPSPMSNLESIFGLFFGTATSAGWATANGDFNTGELVDSPSAMYGNLHQNGLISMANAFNGLGINSLFGINPFDLLFTDDAKNHLFRSSFYFDAEERSNYKFNFDKDFGFLTFLGGPIVSDSGFPDGGRNPYDENGEPILNAYQPYAGVGFANNDFIGWLLGFIVNMIMMGQGPFYCTRNADVNGDLYTYYRNNGYIYAHVYKPDPDDPKTWDYIYPADSSMDATSTAIFYADVDLITDGGVYLENEATVKINIDGITRDITFSGSTIWDQLKVVDKINDAFNGNFTKNPAVPAGKGFQLKGENNDTAVVNIPPEGIIEISDVSGNGIAELIRKGYNGKRKTLREYSGRENRYRERWGSEYYLVEYKPIGGTESIFVTPADMSGNATQPGCLTAHEIIPKDCIERECHTCFAEATNRNFQWCLGGMAFSLPLTLYVGIEHKVIEDALDYLLFDYLSSIPEFILNGIKNNILNLVPGDMGIPITILIEGNGVTALLGLKFPHGGSAENPVMGRWVLNGGFGDSKIPGDYRFNMIFPEKLLSDQLKGILDNLLYYSKFFGIDLGTVDDIIDYAINAVLYGGNLFGLQVDPLLQHNLPLAPTLMLNAQSLCHITYPRCKTEQVVGENAIYNTKDSTVFGGRHGELLKDENGVVHPGWGQLIGGDESDENWRNRNAIGWIFVLICQALRDYVGYDLDLYDPEIIASSVTHNGLVLLINDALGALARTPLCYFEKDGKDSLRPFNSWKQIIKGGKLTPDHPLGEKFYETDKDGDPFTTYNLTPTDFIASSGMNRDTGEPLAPDTKSCFGGWALRNFYSMQNIRNFYNILIDSDPFAEKPGRCDGLLAFVTSYDVYKYDTCEDKPDGAVNSRLITGLIRLVCDLDDPKYDDPFGAKNVDDNDMSTWGLRRKICYGIEQFMTTLRVPKAFPVARNETNFRRIIHPQWMFSEDENGNTYDMRPEDIKLEIAQFPEPPEVEDWSNFDKLMDALGELLSNKGETGGKYNIMEDVIAITNKIFKDVDSGDIHTRGLRHTIGAALTNYNKADSGWEYPDDLLHIVEKELPGILEVFEGHYGNLLTLTDAIIKKNGNDESFMLYIMKNLKSEYPAKDVIEQLYEFIGIDLIKHHDSALWSDLTELLVEFVDMINVEENPGWFENDTFLSNKAVEESDPFGALGELLSW